MAASMTAVPFNIVCIRTSWPGQSTNETWRCTLYVTAFPSNSLVIYTSLFIIPWCLSYLIFVWWATRHVGFGSRHIRAVVNLGIRVAKFDCNVLFQFFLVSNSWLTGDSLHDCRFTVSYVANRTNINCGLRKFSFCRAWVRTCREITSGVSAARLDKSKLSLSCFAKPSAAISRVIFGCKIFCSRYKPQVWNNHI